MDKEFIDGVCQPHSNHLPLEYLNIQNIVRDICKPNLISDPG